MKQVPPQEKHAVQHKWIVGMCGLAASMAWMMDASAQNAGDGAQNLPLPPAHQAQVDLAIAQFRNAHPETGFLQTAGRITRVYGAAFGSGPSPHDSAEQFRLNHAGVLGILADDLTPNAPFEGGAHLQPLMYENGQPKFTAVSYTQTRDNVTVFRAGVTALVRNQAGYPLVLVAANARDIGDFHVTPQDLGGANARAGVATAKKLPQMPRDAVYAAATPVIFAGVDDTPHVPVLAVTFIGEGGNPLQNTYQKRLFVTDAATGALLYDESLVDDIDVTGNVSGMITDNYVADVCANETVHPMQYAAVSIGATTVYADVNGNFTIPNAGTGDVTVTSPMSGRYFVVNDQAGATETLNQIVTPPGPANFLHNAANTSEFIRSEVNVYHHANVVRDMVLHFNPAYPTIANQTGFPINDNIASTCNAFYNGTSINFYRLGGGCNNTGFGTVVHHEYGHHVVASGGSGQGAYGEGHGDIMGLLITDNPVTGVGFQTCSGGIRTADNTCQYSAASCSTCGSEIHACGTLISGCVWSLRNALAATNPSTFHELLGNLVINAVPLHAGSATIGFDIPIDYLTLDDNDNDITNGTPHYNEIATAFNAHGLNVPVLPALVFTYPNGRPATVAPAGGTIIRVVVSAGTGTPAPGATLNVDTGSGFVPIPMTAVSSNTYDGTFPTSPCGLTVRYYISAQTTNFVTSTSPAGAPANFFTAYSANNLVVAFDDNFQTNQGWSVTNDPTLTTGAWDRGVPITICNRGNPLVDGDGSGACYLTQNSSANACDTDVDGGATTLTSPVMDASSGGILSYWRWYSNTQGGAPNTDTMPIQISSNGGTTWQVLETVGPVADANGGWVFKQFNLANISGFALTNQFRVRFIAQDTGAGSVVEAAVDGVRLQRLVCTVIGDVNGDGHVNVDDLLAVITAWGPCPAPPTPCPADVNGDGVVNVNDLLLVITHWG